MEEVTSPEAASQEMMAQVALDRHELAQAMGTVGCFLGRLAYAGPKGANGEILPCCWCT